MWSSLSVRKHGCPQAFRWVNPTCLLRVLLWNIIRNECSTARIPTLPVAISELDAFDTTSIKRSPGFVLDLSRIPVSVVPHRTSRRCFLSPHFFIHHTSCTKLSQKTTWPNITVYRINQFSKTSSMSSFTNKNRSKNIRKQSLLNGNESRNSDIVIVRNECKSASQEVRYNSVIDSKNLDRDRQLELLLDNGFMLRQILLTIDDV